MLGAFRTPSCHFKLIKVLSFVVLVVSSKEGGVCLSVLLPAGIMDASSSPQVSTLNADAQCGGCPPSACTQGSSPWPCLPPSGSGFPAWPAQPAQAAPCWNGQLNAPCWPATQAPPTSVTPSVPTSAPAQAMAPAPSVVLSPTPAPTQAPTMQPSCQPCWPGVQYQPAPPPPAPSIHPSLAGWTAHPGWPYNPGQSGWPGQTPALMPQHWLPPTSGPLNVPYNLNLGRGMYDKMMMTILGYVKPNAKMFTVNFLRGNDIAFHINPRFNEGGKQVVVRNHKLGERWGQEERDLKGPFPFAAGSTFEMKVLCTAEAFRVAVNNIPMFEFRHRIRELNQIDRINILHDVVLTYINVETLP
uniref:Galectin n=1 Tax=Oryzias latipes TaxID=8090 RepID=A0A3P9I4L4_ORYLA